MINEQVILTEAAVNQIAELMLDEPDPETKLRVFVQGGGCSGMQYGFEFATVANEDDFTIEKGQVKILVDSMSMQYLTGATIDYKENIMGSSFTIDNPNAQTSCGCGSSFSV